MKRLLVIAGVVVLLLVGTVAVVSAQTPRNNGGGGCGGFAGTNGNYDYAASPVFKSVADKLGMSASDLATQLKAGKSIAEIANGKASLDDLVNIVSAPRREMMDVAAKYGYMTDEQIKSMNEWMDQQIKAGFQEKSYFPGGMMGPGMMGGGFGGMMRGAGPRFQS